MNALQFSLLGYSIRLAQPEYLLGIVIALLAALFSLYAARRHQRVLQARLGSATLPRVAPTAAPYRQGIKHSLTSLSLALFSLALAQPQCGTHSELAKRYGIDLVIAVDSSSSMLAKDIQPNRLERAKIELTELIDRLSGDRVGIVVFAGDAFAQCPLTTDYAAAKMFLRAINPSHMPVQGTDLARAMEESQALLTAAEHGAKAQAIVLLTDGENTSGNEISQSIKELQSLNIRVFSVGIGSLTGEPIPELDPKGDFTGWKKDKEGNTVMTRLDETGLSQIASETGGRYVHSTSGGIGVEEVAHELNKLNKSEIESRLTVKYAERFQYFVLPGLLLLVVAASIRSGKGKARP